MPSLCELIAMFILLVVSIPLIATVLAIIALCHPTEQPEDEIVVVNGVELNLGHNDIIWRGW